MIHRDAHIIVVFSCDICGFSTHKLDYLHDSVEEATKDAEDEYTTCPRCHDRDVDIGEMIKDEQI